MPPPHPQHMVSELKELVSKKVMPQ